MRHFLDFEKPIAALEGKVEELRHMSSVYGLLPEHSSDSKDSGWIVRVVGDMPNGVNCGVSSQQGPLRLFFVEGTPPSLATRVMTVLMHPSP